MSDLSNLVQRLNESITNKIEPNSEILRKFVQEVGEIGLNSGEVIKSLAKFQEDNQTEFDQLMENFEDDAGVILEYLREYRAIRDEMNSTAEEYQTALKMVEEGGGKPVGNYGQVSELSQYYEYVYDLGIPYKLKAGVPLPYALDNGTYPTAGDDPNLVVFPEVQASDLVTVREDLLGPGTQLYMGDDGDTVKVGDTVPAGTTHLRVDIGGSAELVVMSPATSGNVTALSDTSATIGGVNTLISGTAPSSTTVSSMSGLLKAPRLDGLTVYVNSYHDFWAVTGSMPTGGGAFVWDPNSDKGKHDGGLFIDPDKNYPSSWSNNDEIEDWLTASNSGNGCFVRLCDEIYVEYFGAEHSLVDNKIQFTHSIEKLKSKDVSSIDSIHPQGATLKIKANTYAVSGSISIDFSLCIKGENSNRTFNNSKSGSAIKFNAGGLHLSAGHFQFFDFTLLGTKTHTVNLDNDNYGNVGLLFGNTRGLFSNVEVRDFDCGLVMRPGQNDWWGGAYREFIGCHILRNEYNLVIRDYVTDTRFTSCQIIGNPEDSDGNKRGYVYIKNGNSGYMSANFNNCLLEGLGYVPPGFDFKAVAGMFVGGKNTHVYINGGYAESVSYYVERPASLNRSEFIKNTAVRTTGDGFVDISGSYTRNATLDFGSLGGSNWAAVSATSDGYLSVDDYYGFGYTITDDGSYPQIIVNDFVFMRQVCDASIGDLKGEERIAITMEVDFYAPADSGCSPELRAFTESGEENPGFSRRYYVDDILSQAGEKRVTACLNFEGGAALSYFRPKIDFVGSNGEQIVIKRVQFKVHAG